MFHQDSRITNQYDYQSERSLHTWKPFLKGHLRSQKTWLSITRTRGEATPAVKPGCGTGCREGETRCLEKAYETAGRKTYQQQCVRNSRTWSARKPTNETVCP